MKVTNGSTPTDVVPLAVRYPMLQMWVLIKQLLQQQINKTLGTASTGEEEVSYGFIFLFHGVKFENKIIYCLPYFEIVFGMLVTKVLASPVNRISSYSHCTVVKES